MGTVAKYGTKDALKKAKEEAKTYYPAGLPIPSPGQMATRGIAIEKGVIGVGARQLKRDIKSLFTKSKRKKP